MPALIIVTWVGLSHVRLSDLDIGLAKSTNQVRAIKLGGLAEEGTISPPILVSDFLMDKVLGKGKKGTRNDSFKDMI